MRWKLEGALATLVLILGVLLFLSAPNLVRGWAFSIPGTTDVALEPVFFPRLASSLLISSALLVLATIPLRSGSLPAIETGSDAYLRAGAGLAGILVYLLSVVSLGFVVSTVVFITVGSFVGGYRRLAIVVPVAIGVAVALRLVFRFGLHVGLPEGLLL